MRQPTKAKYISQCMELAILLEASAHKPGNVNRTTNFERTRYEHFLASDVAAAPFFELAAERGIAVSRGEFPVSHVGLGQIIKDCVTHINSWQRGGNTLLGTVILLIPVATAAGMASDGTVSAFELSEVRKNLKLVVESTTPEDAVDVYEAIKIADSNGLGEVHELDVNDAGSIKRISKEKISLYEVFKVGSKHDMVCSEWVTNYHITFDIAYPYLMEQIAKTKDLNMATIHTFLKVLSEYPDTFIAKKVGMEKAQEVSAKARKVLQFGGLATSDGRTSLREFDRWLRKSGNLLNPGTTADITAAALALCVLGGYRP